MDRLPSRPASSRRSSLTSEPHDNTEESESLLSRPAGPSSSSRPPRAVSMRGTGLGKFRAYYLGSVVCIGGFLFGYDSGIVGGVLTLQSFARDYRYSSADATRVASLAVGLQQLGAFVACFLAWPLTDRLGRKKALIISSFVFCIGALIQTANTHSLVVFYMARVTTGLGLGMATVVVPMFSSEMSPKEIRGKIGSFFQWFYTIGIFVSYWVDYAVALGDDSSWQWQIPIGLQLVPGALLGLGMLTLQESTRWLTRNGRHEEAFESLKWIRADASQAVIDEMEGIRLGVEMEARATEGFRLEELLERDNFTRVLTAFAIFLGQQATGATAFAYFGPQYFKLLVGSSGNRDLLLTAVFGAIKVVACAFFVLYVSERVGRRNVLIVGAVSMALCQVAVGVVDKAVPPPTEGNIPRSGIAMVALVYLFVIAYNLSWGPMPWPYVSEIFPARIREPGTAIGVGSQWLFNFVFSLTTPYMISSMGRGTFLLWGVFDGIIAILSFFFLKETKGLSLEAIAHRQFRKGPSNHKGLVTKDVNVAVDGSAP